MLNLFAASINISPLSDAKVIFGQGGGRKYKSSVLPQNCLASAPTKNIQWD